MRLLQGLLRSGPLKLTDDCQGGFRGIVFGTRRQYPNLDTSAIPQAFNSLSQLFLGKMGKDIRTGAGGIENLIR
ncbi:MAG: hypothetical protein JJE30_06095 [Desulfuromonadales bacterium]|nr:hypothetical protein [Desulfuromonadales bacterium]